VRTSGIAETVVLGWVSLYTLGSEEGSRQDRRAEIESDLWEHRNHATRKGDGSAAISLAILGRWMAGIPADVSWRFSQLHSSGGPTKESTMTHILGRYWWQALAALTAVATIYAGIRQFLTDEVSVGVSTGKIIALVFLAAAGILILLGLAIRRTMPRRGPLMVIVGVLPAAVAGLFGIGIILGLIASLTGGEAWWWVPIGVTSAVATAAGVGAFGAWWHAQPVGATGNKRVILLPMGLVLGGLVIALAGVSTGLFPIPLLMIGTVICLVGISVWSRRTHTSP
jgi:hypothetical protein